jgi:hypothetical protein
MIHPRRRQTASQPRTGTAWPHRRSGPGWFAITRCAIVTGVAAVLLAAIGTPAFSAPPITLTLATVPATPGAVFVLDGEALPTNHTGMVKVTVPHTLAGHRLALRSTTVRNGDRESRFVRWWGQRRHEQDLSPTISGLQLRRNLTVQAAFEVQQEVRFRFTDQRSRVVSPKRVTSVTFRSDTGNDQTFRGATTARLLSVHPMLQDSTLVAHQVLYSVQSVEIDGSNVVNVGAQRFRPTQRSDLTLPLLLRRIHLRPRDFVFGQPVGSAMEVTYPDGRLHRYDLDADGTLVLDDLARGTYLVRVDTPGYSPPRPVALSRNQDVPVPVVTRLDLGLLAIVVAAVAFGLLALGRPGRSRQLAGRARRRLLPTRGRGAGAEPASGSEPASTARTAGAEVTPAEVDEDQNRVGAG